ncbi:MAG: DsrE family protein [Euryarchaeota archaeon]|nr:DsrE family protein [Euryarchaeota archaeon]
MKVGIVISSNDPETVWNAFRFANFALSSGDEVKVFLMGKGVEAETLDTENFKVTEQMQSFVDKGGEILACGTCLNLRRKEGSELCPFSTLKDMYEVVAWSEKLLTF